jgi:hypothetical protein
MPQAVLDRNVFKILIELRGRIEAWLADCDEPLPHNALGDLIPVDYRVLHHPEPSDMRGTDFG